MQRCCKAKQQQHERQRYNKVSEDVQLWQGYSKQGGHRGWQAVHYG